MYSSITYTTRGLQHPRLPHVLLSLQGRFKNVIGRRRHQIPLIPKSASGIRMQQWLLRLFLCFRKKKVPEEGPLFRNELDSLTPIRVRELDVLFHKYLLIVQQRFPSIISPSVDVESVYSIMRSLRRGATAQARNDGVSKDTVLLNNRWRSEELGPAPSGEMMEYYTDVVVAVGALLKFSTLL